MRRALTSLLAIALTTCCYAPPLLADYTLVLKNGRRIIVHSYREQGSTLHFYALGGEFGIAKDQVRTIIKSGETDPTELNDADVDRAFAQSPPLRPADPTARPAPADAAERSSPAAAGDDQKRLAEINQKLDAAQARYVAATEGGGLASSATKEGYRAWTADLMARLKSRRGAADSEYEPQEREIRDLRLEIDKLRKERDELAARVQNTKP